jgi:hypothetical protein
MSTKDQILSAELHGEALLTANRAMLLEQVHPFDPTEYEPADIEPYLLPPGI